MGTIKDTPERDEIAASLTHTYGMLAIQANMWADYLNGLPWRYIHPVTKIAMSAHHEHPALVLQYAASYSEDQEFKAAAKQHLEQRQAGGQ